jgi:hypothetical protein
MTYMVVSKWYRFSDLRTFGPHLPSTSVSSPTHFYSMFKPSRASFGALQSSAFKPEPPKVQRQSMAVFNTLHCIEPGGMVGLTKRPTTATSSKCTYGGFTPDEFENHPSLQNIWSKCRAQVKSYPSLWRAMLTTVARYPAILLPLFVLLINVVSGHQMFYMTNPRQT